MSLTSFDCNVCNALMNLVDGTTTSSEKTLTTYGNGLYGTLAEFLNGTLKFQLLPHTTSGKVEEGKKKLSTKEQIVLKNSVGKMEEKIKNVAGSILMSQNSLDIGTFIFTNDNVDIRTIGFTYLLWIISEKDVEQLDAFRVIVSSQRYLKTLSSSQFQDMTSGKLVSVPTQFVTTMKTLIEKSTRKYDFRGDLLYELDPSLIVESKWDMYVPRSEITAFEHQKKMSDLILNIGRRYDEKPLMSFYVEVRVLTSAGKTTSIVNVAAALRKRLVDFPSLKLYAVCAIEPIRRRWANLLSYCEIPYFSYDEFVDFNPDEKDVETASKKHISGSLVVICSPEQSIKHLKANPNCVLFYDEPTMYADGTNVQKLLAGVSVLKCMPRFTFLCSATLDIPNHELYEYHKKSFPESVFIDIFSPKIYGYTNIKTNDGIVVSPHMCCKTKEDLLATISSLEKSPLLGKFYNPFVVRQLYTSAKKYTTVINVDEIFGNVENLTPDVVRKTAYQILTTMASSLTDSQIEDVCHPVKTGEKITYSTLGTTDAHKYQHPNLVATSDPLTFTTSNFGELANDVKKDIVSYKSLLTPYNKWKDQREEIIKRNPVLGEESERTLQQLLEKHDADKPQSCIPEKFQINTVAHTKKYHGSYNNQRSRKPMLNFYDCGSVTETVDTLFHCGVGIYAPAPEGAPKKPGDMPKKYTNLLIGKAKEKRVCYCPGVDTKDKKVMQKTESAIDGFVTNGDLEFVVSNEEIAYGIDCPFGGLFVDKNLSEKISLNTLFQLISRIGRGRKSPYANVFVDKSVVSDILEMIRDEEYENEETSTILEVFDALSFCVIENNHAIPFVRIPIDETHTKIRVHNSCVSLLTNEEIKWSGTTKYTKSFEYTIDKKKMLMCEGKVVGVVF